MSIAASMWAWQQETESSGQRLVLLALADAAGGAEEDERLCWPSVARISKMADIGESTVRKHMERLEENGQISKVRRRRRRDGTLGTWVITVNFTTAHPAAVDEPTTAHPAAVDHRSPSGALEPSRSKPSLENMLVDDFDSFWQAYPRKTSKPDAHRAYLAARKKADHQTIMRGLADHSYAWAKGEKRFIPHASTWLRREGWNDEVIASSNQSKAGSVQQTVDIGRRIMDQLPTGGPKEIG